MRRARHLKPFVARLHGREPRLEGRAAIERTRLIRGPGAELRIAAAGGEIGIGLGIGDDAHGAFDANLPAQRFPVEKERGLRIFSKVIRLAALLVGVEDEPTRVMPLQEHHPHRGLRSEEHTSELQSLMRSSYAVFCLKKKKK